jgi:hypothetical protein
MGAALGPGVGSAVWASLLGLGVGPGVGQGMGPGVEQGEGQGVGSGTRRLIGTRCGCWSGTRKGASSGARCGTWRSKLMLCQGSWVKAYPGGSQWWALGSKCICLGILDIALKGDHT